MSHRYVVFGDVVASREVRDHGRFRNRIADACETVNDAYEDDLSAPFEILEDDSEFRGVLTSPGCVYDVVNEFAAALRPHEVRLAFAADQTDAESSTRDVTRMDGRAFHRADELLVGLEDTAFRVAIDFTDSSLDDILTDEINLLLFRKRGWTDRQREVVALYEEYQSQSEVAAELGISQPAVSRALDRAMWKPVREIEQRLREVLAQYE